MTADDLTTDQLADRLRVSPRTVEAWRRTGRGPAYRRQDGRVLYRLVDVLAWEDARDRGTTLEEDQRRADQEATAVGLLRAILEELQALRREIRARRSA